jgi:hypothetical protein
LGRAAIHGELLKLPVERREVLSKRCRPPSQGWRTFLCNHAPDLAAMDLFVVPTIGFGLLCGFVIIRLARRHLVWINGYCKPDPQNGLRTVHITTTANRNVGGQTTSPASSQNENVTSKTIRLNLLSYIGSTRSAGQSFGVKFRPGVR